MTGTEAVGKFQAQFWLLGRNCLNEVRFGTERPLVRIQSPRPFFPAKTLKQAQKCPVATGHFRALYATNRDGNGIGTESTIVQIPEAAR